MRVSTRKEIAASGIAAWRPLGEGLTGANTSAENTNGAAMTVYQGELIVGGGFMSAGGAAIPGLAKWDGTRWSDVEGFATFGIVRSVGVCDGDLVIGGAFSWIVNGSAWHNIARLSGATWVAIPPFSDQVRAVAEYRGSIYAGRGWTGGVSVLDGSSWQIAGGGVGTPLADHGSFGQVNALVEHHGELWAGGWFLTAGGRVSAHLARWGCPCYANCDGSSAPGALNVSDFVCFQQRFAAGDPYANCDGSTGAPTLNAADFMCFLSEFAQGCR